MNAQLKKRFIIIIIILGIIFGGTFLWDAIRSIFIKRFFANFKQPPATVSVVTAKKQTWYPRLNAVGTLVAVNGVDVSSEVNGQVLQIFFKSGTEVKKGDALVQLDDSIDQQNLVNDMAQLRLDSVNFQRQQQLYERHVTAKSAYDEAQAKLEQAQAAVKKDQVMIDKKKIKAPFDGKIGIRQVNLGQYVNPGQGLVTLQSLDPLYVDFTLPEQDLPMVYQNQLLEIQVDAYPKKIFKGNVIAINASVDVNTRTILSRGQLSNPEKKLFPGIFADVDIILPQQQNVVTVPQTAVAYSLYGDSIYVVSEKGKDKKGNPILIVNQRYVKLGQRQGNEIVIQSGLNSGEMIVTSGQLKLSNNREIKINNQVSVD